ncbi:MAG: ABC transporter ATP-binding protein [Gammaproteobacteria bacterium]|jgi:ATP-binding cassette subfamily C protein|nr:ABC transporter ATP-binding protein [Gammaproteobacteria bacterium]
MRLLLSLARQYPWRTLLTMLSLILAGLAESIGLSALLQLPNVPEDAVTDPGNLDLPGWLDQLIHLFGLDASLSSLLLLLFVGFWIKAILILLANRQVGYTVARIATDLRGNLMRALMQARWVYYQTQSTGGLANAVAAEAMRASEAFLQGARMVSMLVQGIVAMLVGYSFSPLLTGITLTGGMLILAVLNILVRITRLAGEDQTLLMRSLVGRLTDLMSSLKSLKAMARERHGSELLEGETEELNRALQRQVLSRETLRAMQDPLFVSLAVIGIYAAIYHMDQSISTIMQNVILFALLARGMERLYKVQQFYQDLAGSESAYFAIVRSTNQARAQKEPVLGTQQPALRRMLQLREVSFAYDDQKLLDAISVQIPVHQMVTLTGHSGAGKTTVIDLIAGLIRPQQGDVWIDDTPLAEVDIRRWRQRIGYVPQDTVLLHNSIAYNVALGDRHYSRADIERALTQAGAMEFVNELPDGMDTLVGERGGRFSGGQRQRIIIARALVGKPDLLILDEATSALDEQSEQRIAMTLRQLTSEVTILAISHRPALIECADTVYFLQDGKARVVPKP